MSRKFIFVTAVAVCVALAFAPAFADRSVDRSADRSDRAANERGSQSTATDVQQMQAPLQRARTLVGADALTQAQNGLAAAAKQDGAAAVQTLQKVVNLDLPQNAAGDELRAQAYARLGQLNTAPQKQVAYFGIALQYATDAGTRSQLESAIADLGGNVFDLAVRPNGDATASTRDAGPDDTCGGAVPYPGMPITMSITPSGDANWVSFSVAGPDGEVVRVETITDQPGTTADDTTLDLYGTCVGGVEDDALDSNDDWGGGSCAANDPGYVNSGQFMSCMQAPLLPGTYYVRVGGFFDSSTPDNFDLAITTLATFDLPEPDAFEGDDTPADAADIGFATSIPTQGNGWGRAHKEIQSHTIFPAGDVDHQRIRLNRSEIVRMSATAQFPTFFNGFESSAAGDNPDTVLDLLYGTEPDYGGRCNQPNAGFVNVCFSDADCDGLIGPDAIPGQPDCLPIQFFNGGVISSTVPNPLAGNDDAAGLGFGSNLDGICLPRETVSGATTTREWVSRVRAFGAADFFEYEVLVRNQVQCRFEDEIGGNDWLFGAVPDPNAAEDLTIGETVHGIYDFASSNPFADSDVFKFDVDEETFAVIRTDGYDAAAVDTYLEIFVGPDDNGDFFLTGISDEDGGDTFLSLIEVILPPADDLLGNTTADANYYVQNTSRYFNPNYPWTLITEAAEPPLFGTEGDGTCDGEGALNPIAPGDEYQSAIDVPCDFDAYKMSLGADTFVSISTLGGDTTLQIEDCDTGDIIACDDDSNPAGGFTSLSEGCLPAGDYCLRVRAFSAFASFPYTITVDGGQTGCTPSGMSGDGLYTCTDYDSCGN